MNYETDCEEAQSRTIEALQDKVAELKAEAARERHRARCRYDQEHARSKALEAKVAELEAEKTREQGFTNRYIERLHKSEAESKKMAKRVEEFELAKPSWHRLRDEMNGLRDFLYKETLRPCYAEADDFVDGPVASVIGYVEDLKENIRVESGINNGLKKSAEPRPMSEAPVLTEGEFVRRGFIWIEEYVMATEDGWQLTAVRGRELPAPPGTETDKSGEGE